MVYVVMMRKGCSFVECFVEMNGCFQKVTQTLFFKEKFGFSKSIKVFREISLFFWSLRLF